MFSMKVSTAGPRGQVNQIRSAVESNKPQLLNALGAKLVGLAGIYFDNLSRGGSSFSGRKWPAPKESTVKKRKALAKRGRLRSTPETQGIVTGEMRQSLTYMTSQDAVKITYRSPHAKYFNVHRRLIPSRLPTPWRDACEAEAAKFLPQ